MPLVEEPKPDITAGKTPEECQDLGLWECDPVYYAVSQSSSGPPSASKRQKRGKAWRDLKTSHFVAFQSYDGVVYRIGDTVFLESQQAELPFFICGIQGFKMTKREQLNVHVRWYYRTCEVPQTLYNTLTQDRHTEHEHSDWIDEELCIKNPAIRPRELFISDAHDTYSVSNLRGKCVIRHFRDIREAAAFEPVPASFFYVLGYNPENNRLATIQGEIRVGPSHQAKLPEWRGSERPGRDYSDETEAETLVWEPSRICDTDLHTFVGAVRSLAAFAGFRASAASEDPAPPPSRDHHTFSALHLLHEKEYAHGPALATLVREGISGSPETLWDVEEVAKFKKGLKQWGKNFFRIRKELLSHRTTSQLIEFYYLWKKSPAAKNQSVRQRQRRPQNVILRRIKGPSASTNSKPPRPASSEFLDLSSASENEQESEESDSKDLTGYACHHCYTTVSDDWHHCGKDRLIFCTGCRVYFKQYGELRPVDRAKTPPPYLFKPLKGEEEENEESGVQTRGRASASKEMAAIRRRTFTPTPEMEVGRNGAKSPSAGSTSSSSSLDTEPLCKEEIKGTSANLAVSAKKGGSGGKKNRRKRRRIADDGKAAAAARKKRKRILEEANKRASETNDGDESESGAADSSPPSVSGENSTPPSPALETPMDTSPVVKQEAADPYEYTDKDEELVENGGPLSVKNGVDSSVQRLMATPIMPKAETSVIQVNMSQKEDAIMSFGTKLATKFRWSGPPRAAGEEAECSRTYLEYQRDPAAPWLNRSKEKKRVKAEPKEGRSESSSRPSAAESVSVSTAAPPASAPPPPPMGLPTSMGMHGLPGGLPPWAAAHMQGMDSHSMMAMQQLMQHQAVAAQMGGGGHPMFAQPGGPFMGGPDTSAMHHLQAMARQGQQQQYFQMAAHDVTLQRHILDGNMGPETRIQFAEFILKNGVRQQPELEMKTRQILGEMEQRQQAGMMAMFHAQAQQQAHMVAAQKAAAAQQAAQREREMDRQREMERQQREKERQEKERRERELKERREREQREREDQIRMQQQQQAAAAAKALTPAPSAPPPRVTPSVGPPRSIPPPSPFLNGMDPRAMDPRLLGMDPRTLLEFQTLMSADPAGFQRQLQEVYQQQHLQQLQQMANAGDTNARDRLAAILAPQHHLHTHAHAHTHLHLTAQLPGANGSLTSSASVPDGLSAKGGGPPKPAPHLRQPGLTLPTVSSSGDLLNPFATPHLGGGFPGMAPLEAEMMRNRMAFEAHRSPSSATSEMMRRLASEGTGNPLQPPPHP